MPMGPIDYSGLGGDTNGIWVAQDMPTGATDGVNTVFVLTDLPKTDSEIIRKNGLVLVRNWDYTIVGNTLTIMTPPLPTDYITASYFK
jgi:hypothetical protein